jgi:hypothetical protein
MAYGAGGALLVLGALGALGEQPRMEDTTETVTLYYTAERTKFLVCTYVAALGLMLTLLFLARLADQLGDQAKGEARLLRAGYAAGALWIGTIVIGMAFPIYVAYRGPKFSPETARALVELFPIIAGLSCFPTAAQLWCYARVQSSLRMRTATTIGFAVTAAHLIAAACFASAGAFAPTGIFPALLVPLSYYVWVIASCARAPSANQGVTK